MSHSPQNESLEEFLARCQKAGVEIRETPVQEVGHYPDRKRRLEGILVNVGSVRETLLKALKDLQDWISIAEDAGAKAKGDVIELTYVPLRENPPLWIFEEYVRNYYELLFRLLVASLLENDCQVATLEYDKSGDRKQAGTDHQGRWINTLLQKDYTGKILDILGSVDIDKLALHSGVPLTEEPESDTWNAPGDTQIMALLTQSTASHERFVLLLSSVRRVMEEKLSFVYQPKGVDDKINIQITLEHIHDEHRTMVAQKLRISPPSEETVQTIAQWVLSQMSETLHPAQLESMLKGLLDEPTKDGFQYIARDGLAALTASREHFANAIEGATASVFRDNIRAIELIARRMRAKQEILPSTADVSERLSAVERYAMKINLEIVDDMISKMKIMILPYQPENLRRLALAALQITAGQLAHALGPDGVQRLAESHVRNLIRGVQLGRFPDVPAEDIERLTVPLLTSALEIKFPPIKKE